MVKYHAFTGVAFYWYVFDDPGYSPTVYPVRFAIERDEQPWSLCLPTALPWALDRFRNSASRNFYGCLVLGEQH